MHNLLKELNCGPEEFLVANLKEPRCRSHEWENWVEQHGVITKEVNNFIMASALSTQELLTIIGDSDQYQADMFLLTLLIALGQFANIPCSWDNWGFIKQIDVDTKRESYRLAVVDFSSDGGRNALSSSETLFLVHWRGSIYFLPKGNNQRVSIELCTVHVASQLFRYDWLQSKETFVSTLQRVCDTTFEWVKRQMNNPPCGNQRFKLSAYPALSEVGYPLKLRHGFIPDKRTRAYEDRVAGYYFWVEEWNKTLNLLFEWLVFPTRLTALD